MSKKGKIIYLTIFSCLFVILFSNLPVFAENPLPVSGRCLSLSNSREFGFSDISEWIEIATFENYSLILRKLPIECKKSFGTSSTKKYVNDWFQNLKPDDPLKFFAVGTKIFESAGSSSASQSEQYSIHFPSQEAEKSPFLLTPREISLYKISNPFSETTENFFIHPAIWVRSPIFDCDLPSFASVKNYTQEQFDTQKIKIHELKAKNPKDPKIDLEMAIACEMDASSEWSNTIRRPDKKNWKFAQEKWEKSKNQWEKVGNQSKKKLACAYAKSASTNILKIQAMQGISGWEEVEIARREEAALWLSAENQLEADRAAADALWANAEYSYTDLIKNIPLRKDKIHKTVEKFFAAATAWKNIDSKMEGYALERANSLKARAENRASVLMPTTHKAPETKEISEISPFSFSKYPNATDFKPSQYMDDQAQRGWCWIVAVQGMINKKFGIYDPVEDMFYMYFGKYSFTDDDEDNRGGTGDAICYLTNIILDRYGMYSHYPHKFLVKVIKTEIEKTFSDIYEKYGPFVSRCCSNKNHVILIASVDKLKRELTIENWGTNYKMPFDDFYSQCEKTYGADNLIYIVFVEEKIPEKVKILKNTIAKQEFFSLFMDAY